jgi:hypothetical protein
MFGSGFAVRVQVQVEHGTPNIEHRTELEHEQRTENPEP